MRKTGIIFPNQLFEKIPFGKDCEHLFLVEENLFFKQHPFHKQKLAYHRATMKFYEKHLSDLGRKVTYIDSDRDEADVRILIARLAQRGVRKLEIIDVADNWLWKRIRWAAEQNGIAVEEFDPDEVYRWFMTLYIDAYDWVMVPNVYGMSQFADGGMMSTKPYISGSNYLRKMSNYPKGEWQQVWDALFWRFMHVHRDFFSKNPRLGMLVRSFDKMDKAKQERLLDDAEIFIKHSAS